MYGGTVESQRPFTAKLANLNVKRLNRKHDTVRATHNESGLMVDSRKSLIS